MKHFFTAIAFCYSNRLVKTLSMVFFLAAAGQTVCAQVKIGNNPTIINSRSLLELESTDKGLVLPRLNNTQMSILGSAGGLDGMVIYNTDTKAMYVFRNSQFVRLADTTRTITFPYTAIVNTVGDGFSLSNNGSGRAIAGNATGGNGITGTSFSGTGGVFSSNSGYALTTLSGNVGLGTSSPAYQLDVNGRARIRYNGGTAGIWYNKADNTEASFNGQFNDTIAGIYGPGIVGGWKFLYDYKNTRLGIGTATPQYPLTFANTTGDKISLYGGSLNPATNHYGLGIQGSQLQIFVPSAAEDIVFGTGRSNALTERVRFTGDGNVGIGINNPVATLQVARGTGANGTAVFEGTTNSSNFNFGTTEDTYIRGGKATSRVIINDNASGNVNIGTGGGNLGIGVANNLISEKLHVDGGSMKLGNATWSSAASDRLVKFGDGSFVSIGEAAADDRMQLTAKEFVFKRASGNTSVGINTFGAPTAPLEVNGKVKISTISGANALEISGGIKVYGTDKPVFQLTVDASNQILGTDEGNGPPVVGFKINNVFSNNDPNAIIFVTPVNDSYSPNHLICSVFYNEGTGFWDCQTSKLYGTAVSWNLKNVVSCNNSFQNNEGCIDIGSVTAVKNSYLYSDIGAKYNIMIIKQ